MAQPTGYKPFLLLFVLFGFQQASGTLIILTYGVSLFQVSVDYTFTVERNLEKMDTFGVILIEHIITRELNGSEIAFL